MYLKSTKIINNLNSRKATGADEIPAWLLKRFHEELAPVVHDIICCSIKECKFPVSHKHALITPIPKVSCPKDIENDFRQVSILPHMAKLLEKHQLLLNKSDILLNNTQHGFTEGRSTVSALSFVFGIMLLIRKMVDLEYMRYFWTSERPLI